MRVKLMIILFLCYSMRIIMMILCTFYNIIFSVDSVDHLDNVFKTPSFDISNFKIYFEHEEYQELVNDFGKYAHGENEEEKVAFIKSKLLGHKGETDIQKAITEVLIFSYRITVYIEPQNRF
jgi:hypothetical protein